MAKHRPTKLVLGVSAAALVAAVGVAAWRGPDANWDLLFFAVLLALSAISDLTAARTRLGVRISGSFLALVVAMVYLGGAPAALLGVVTIAIGSIRWREPTHYFLNNLVTYAWFPLLGGIAFHAARSGLSLGPDDASFYLLVLGLFILALGLNFLLIAGYGCYVRKGSLSQEFKTALVPLLPSELMAALMSAGVVFLYHEIGLAAVALFGVVLVTFQYLLGALIVSQQRAEDLEKRTKQLVSFQVGMLSALMKTLDLRDEMTARHSASVARYARAIAKASGMSQSDQELVHIVGLVHDIGKFILPDHILKANVPLSDDDWNLIKMHPQQGANVVSSLEGYGPVAKIVLAHHERIDGKGYPRGLKGDQIPEMSRIISVADTYDVMTARDSYKEPVSSFEAIQELQRVAGAQLDARFVRIFVEEVLEGKDLTFRHGENADFDVELALEERIAAVEEQSGRFLVGGARVG
jgi:putative nucleotidyltransferase with HDIG domain